MDKERRIDIAGHRGLVGSALVRALTAGGYRNLGIRTQAKLDPTDQSANGAFCASETPDYASLAAAKIGVDDDVTIAELAGLVRQSVGFTADIAYNAGKPDGTPRKLLYVDRMHTAGCRARTSPATGLARAYADFRGGT